MRFRFAAAAFAAAALLAGTAVHADQLDDIKKKGQLVGMNRSAGQQGGRGEGGGGETKAHLVLLGKGVRTIATKACLVK